MNLHFLHMKNGDKDCTYLTGWKINWDNIFPFLMQWLTRSKFLKMEASTVRFSDLLRTKEYGTPSKE